MFWYEYLIFAIVISTALLIIASMLWRGKVKREREIRWLLPLLFFIGFCGVQIEAKGIASLLPLYQVEFLIEQIKTIKKEL